MSTSDTLNIPENTTAHPRYDAYKDSGVEWLGEIPEHWEIVQLKFRATFKGGGTPSKDNRDYWTGNIPWVSPKDMKVGAVVDTEDHITREAVRESSTSLVKPGSVLIVVRSGILKHTIPVATNDVEVALNQDLKAVTPDERLDAHYLAYLIRGKNDILLLEWTKSGTTVESLEHDRIANTETPIPPLPEQRAIAAYLDRETERIDALVAKKERLIELLEEKRTALISHAVTKGLDADAEMKDSGVEWLGKIPAGWDTVKLKWATSKIGSGVTPKGGSEAYVDEGITFLRSQNVHFDGLRLEDVAYIDEETDSEMKGSRVKPHDVLLNITGASLGRCAIVPGDFPRANVNQHVCIIRVERDKLQPTFLSQVLASDVGQQQIFAEEDGASREAITFAEIGDFVMPRPPGAEQERIASYADAESNRIYTLIDRIRDGIDRLKEYRTALISAAVTGQVDVFHE